MALKEHATQFVQITPFFGLWAHVVATTTLMTLSGLLGWAFGHLGFRGTINAIKTDIESLKTKVDAGVTSVKAS